jgi:DNA-binding beta-propeller fold protein YncE
MMRSTSASRPLKPTSWIKTRRALAQAAGFFSAVVALAAPQRFVRDGVAVEFSITAASGELRARETETARVRFTITDTTTGQPVRRLHPAAWLSRRNVGGPARPNTCAEKVQELLGGSIFSKADLDLNSFQVVALNDDASLTVVDPLFGFGGTKLLAMIPLPGVGSDWILSPDGRKVFVTIPNPGKVAVVDTATWKVATLLDAGSSPGRVAIQPDGHYAWVADATGVMAIEVDRAMVAGRIATGEGVHEIVFSADSRWAFVTNPASRTLSVVDILTLKKIRDIPLPGSPVSAAYSNASAAIYLTDEANGQILVLDGVRHEIVARIAAEPGMNEIKFAPGDRFALVANPARNLVLVVDAATNRIVQRAKIEHGPEQFAFSSDMAFIRRRGTATVAMIPLKELGREGQAVPVADFTGGEAAFGSRTSLAPGLVPAPGETAVIVANPVDKAIYYYMEGMAAPMGNFSNYGRQPRAALVVDRSLREVSPGVYEAAAKLPDAGDYDAVFFLDAPRVTHCFTATIEPDPSRARSAPAVARLEPVASSPKTLVAGQPARLTFRLHHPNGSLTVPTDLVVRTMLAPGVWHVRVVPTFTSEGDCVVEFTPPNAGIYYFYAESPSLGLASNQPPCLVLRATEPVPAVAK